MEDASLEQKNLAFLRYFFGICSIRMLETSIIHFMADNDNCKEGPLLAVINYSQFCFNAILNNNYVNNRENNLCFLYNCVGDRRNSFTIIYYN